MTIVLPGERPWSWNRFYAGAHWAVRRREVERVRLAVRAALPWAVVNGVGWPATGPVAVELRVYFDRQPQDADNICTKLYVDALKGWCIVDDGPAWVTRVTPVSLVDKRQPRVELELIAVGTVGIGSN